MIGSTRLENAQSMHPKLQITVPQSFFSDLSTVAECSPAVLIRLPPALFIDPNTFPSKAHSHVQSLRHLGSDHPSLSSYDFTRVELEAGVGYSDRSGAGRAKTGSQASASRREVKRVSGDKYIAANKGSLHSRYQDRHADARRSLAKEHRAALLTLKMSKSNRETESVPAEDQYDSLTGEAIGRATPMALIEIPIHTRYVEPVKGGAKWTESNYEQHHLDKPELFWMCDGQEHSIDSSVYEQIDASELLPTPHSHLSLQLPSSLQFYRLKMEDQETSFDISIPAGNVSLAPIVHIATFGSLILAALLVIVQVQSILRRLHTAQSAVLKHNLGKTD